MGSLTGRKGSDSFWPSTIDTMLNFDRHCDGDGNGVRTCKHTFTTETLIQIITYYILDSILIIEYVM